MSDARRRAYISHADSVCRSLDPKRSAARQRVGEAANEHEAIKAYDEGIGLADKQLRRLEAIPRPRGDASVLRTNVFSVLRRQLALRRQIRTGLKDKNVAELKSRQRELENLTRSLVGFARGYGFKVCGEV